MLLIRAAEEQIGDMVLAGNVHCPCHLGIGQEAIAVGVSANLRTTDRIFGGHRSHPHYLALGGDLRALFAEVLGRETGCSKGMGGSMHLYDAAHGFWGSVPIVGATIPLAVGAALACQKDHVGNVAVSYFGDGATEEGGFHESLNFASLYKLPVLFACENNLFSSHMHISQRQTSDSVARFAAAHGIRHAIVDGNDVIAVSQASKALLNDARMGAGPGFLEAVTYRWRGHVGPHEDLDVGVKRGGELGLWKHRDPVQRLYSALEARAILNAREMKNLQLEIAREIAVAWLQAEADPFPRPSATLGLVYAGQ
jgi:pyruvate dehydrogenase E1 component alpha subunit